jgi:hypothetical protein
LANNPDRAETFHEIPASQYWYLGDKIGAVPKNLFKIWTPLMFAAGVILTLLTEHTSFWSVIGSAIWNVLIVKFWYVTLPVGAVATVALYYWNRSRQNRKIRERKERARARRLRLLLEGGDKK